LKIPTDCRDRAWLLFALVDGDVAEILCHHEDPHVTQAEAEACTQRGSLIGRQAGQCSV